MKYLGKITDNKDLVTKEYVDNSVSGKQDTLVSGTNIKTINNQSILGSGNIDVSGTVDSAISSTSTNPLENRAIYNVLDNSSDNIYIDSTTNKLMVGGRLGQSATTTGIYAPATISPESVGNGSLLLTEANNTTLGSKSLSVTTGLNLTCQSAAAGATSYVINNTYENQLKAYLAIGGLVALNEANAANTVKVTSVTVNGQSSWVPSSNTTGQIVINVASTVNPDAATTSIRIYPAQNGFSNLSIGQGISVGTGGASALVGQGVYNNSNASVVVGASMYNTGNGSAVFGRQHKNVKNRAFLAGTGHDTSNGPSEGVAALGQWSNITSDTSFVVGNGSSATSRSNLLELKSTGNLTIKGKMTVGSAPTANLDVATKKYVDDSIASIPTPTAATSILIYLYESSWQSDNTQTYTVSTLTSRDDVIISPRPQDAKKYAESEITCEQNGNSLIFKCSYKPYDNIYVNALIFK